MTQLNLLISHAYADGFWEEFILEHGGKTHVFLMDSGAFTVHNAGGVVSLDDYCARLDRIGRALWQYIMLDVVGDWPASQRNLDEMTARGFRPMPVLTTDADINLVEGFMEVNEHMCVAGGVSQPTDWYSARIEKAWRASGKRAKIHGLGYTRGLAPLRSRVVSIDSSTWIVGQRYGNITIYDPTTATLRQKNWKKYCVGKKLNEMPRGLVDLLLSSKVKLEQLDSANKGNPSLVSLFTAHAWVRYYREAARRGIKLFFALGSRDYLLVLAAANAATGADGSFDYQVAKELADEATARTSTAAGFLDAFAWLSSKTNWGS